MVVDKNDEEIINNDGFLPEAEDKDFFKNVAIYVRADQEELAENPGCIEEQLEVCRAYAAEYDKIVVYEFVEKAADKGDVFSRSEIDSVRAWAFAADFSTLLVSTADRISYDNAEYEKLEHELLETGIEIVLVK